MRTPQVDALPGMTPLGLAEGGPHKGDTMTTAQSTEVVELIVLGDDGAMDTVVYCTKCGEEFRGNWDGGGTDDGLPHRFLDDDGYDDYVDWLIADVTAEHECPKQ